MKESSLTPFGLSLWHLCALLTTALIAAVVLWAGEARAGAQASSEGTFKYDSGDDLFLFPRGTGDVCVHVMAGGNSDPPVRFFSKCTVPAERHAFAKDYDATGGIGRTAPKDFSDGSFDEVRNSVIGGFPARVARAVANYEYVRSRGLDRAAYFASAEVVPLVNTVGLARAFADDPIEFVSPSDGSFALSASISGVRLQAVGDAFAGVHAFFRVDGIDLFDLTIGGFGTFTSLSDIGIDFQSLLAASHDQMILDQIRDSLIFDPSTGFVTMTTLVQLLPNDYMQSISAGPHSISSGFGAVAEAVPEPSALTLLSLGLGALALTGYRASIRGHID